MYAFDLPLWTHLTPGEESLKKSESTLPEDAKWF